MSRSKLKKFAEIKVLSNVYDPDSFIDLSWRKDIFKNDNPLFVELACGKAKFSIQMAEKFPNINFIAIDRKGERVWYGATEALEKKLTNLKFFQGNINYLEKEFKNPNDKIDEIWITFPDPFPKDRNARQRLTHKKFLTIYKKALKENGILNLKTDFTPLHDFTRKEIIDFNGKILIEQKDIHNTPSTLEDHIFFKTDYENFFIDQQKAIHYLRAEI
jgi:tRNA (guanine-N7-)-methyltransferase